MFFSTLKGVFLSRVLTFIKFIFSSLSAFLHPGDWSDPAWCDECSGSRRIQQRAALQGLRWPPWLSDIKNLSPANVSLYSAAHRFVFFFFFPAEGTAEFPWSGQFKWSDPCLRAFVHACRCAHVWMLICVTATGLPLRWISTHSCTHSDHEPNDDKLFLFPDSLLPHKSDEFWMWQEMKFIFHHNKVMSARAPATSTSLCNCVNAQTV